MVLMWMSRFCRLGTRSRRDWNLSNSPSGGSVHQTCSNEGSYLDFPVSPWNLGSSTSGACTALSNAYRMDARRQEFSCLELEDRPVILVEIHDKTCIKHGSCHLLPCGEAPIPR